MTALDEKDVVVIGGGPAGFLAALRASQLGGKVTLVEKEKLGGICVNWGCIPMCFLVHSVEVLNLIKEAGKYGINTGRVRVDFARLMSEKEKVVRNTVNGMETRLQTSGVQVVSGLAQLASADRVGIEYAGGKKDFIPARTIIIATGSMARRYEVPGAYDAGVLTAKELLCLNELPKSLAIIGRSVTALELATVWNKLGSVITLIARRPQVLPGEDEDAAACVLQALKEDGVRVYAGVDIERIDESKEGKDITISSYGVRQKVAAQFVVFAIGQTPLVNGIGLENVGIAATGGRIRTNSRMETSVKRIYAVGDATGETMLANVAMVQGAVAAENALGRNTTMDYRVVPRFIRTLPPMGAVGITDGEAKKQGLDIKISKYPFEQNAKAGIIGDCRGFVKIIAGAASGEILGVHIVGPEATEMIHEAVIAMQMRGTVRDVAVAIHSHPSLHEAMQRAAQSLSR